MFFFFCRKKILSRGCSSHTKFYLHLMCVLFLSLTPISWSFGISKDFRDVIFPSEDGVMNIKFDGTVKLWIHIGNLNLDLVGVIPLFLRTETSFDPFLNKSVTRFRPTFLETWVIPDSPGLYKWRMPNGGTRTISRQTKEFDFCVKQNQEYEVRLKTGWTFCYTIKGIQKILFEEEELFRFKSHLGKIQKAYRVKRGRCIQILDSKFLGNGQIDFFRTDNSDAFFKYENIDLVRCSTRIADDVSEHRFGYDNGKLIEYISAGSSVGIEWEKREWSNKRLESRYFLPIMLSQFGETHYLSYLKSGELVFDVRSVDYREFSVSLNPFTGAIDTDVRQLIGD